MIPDRPPYSRASLGTRKQDRGLTRPILVPKMPSARRLHLVREGSQRRFLSNIGEALAISWFTRLGAAVLNVDWLVTGPLVIVVDRLAANRRGGP